MLHLTLYCAAEEMGGFIHSFHARLSCLNKCVFFFFFWCINGLKLGEKSLYWEELYPDTMMWKKKDKIEFIYNKFFYKSASFVCDMKVTVLWFYGINFCLYKFESWVAGTIIIQISKVVTGCSNDVYVHVWKVDPEGTTLASMPVDGCRLVTASYDEHIGLLHCRNFTLSILLYMTRSSQNSGIRLW